MQNTPQCTDICHHIFKVVKVILQRSVKKQLSLLTQREGSILLCSSEIYLLGGIGGGSSVSGVHSNDASYLKEPWFSNPRTTSSYMHEVDSRIQLLISLAIVTYIPYEILVSNLYFSILFIYTSTS